MLNEEFVKLCKENGDEKIKELPSLLNQFSEFISKLPDQYNLVLSAPEHFQDILK